MFALSVQQSRGSLGDSWASCCRYIVPFSYHFACPPFPIILLLKSRETFCMRTFSRGFLCLRSLKRPMLLSKIWLFGGLKHKQLYGSLVLSELTCDRYWQSPLYLFCKLQCIRNRCFCGSWEPWCSLDHFKSPDTFIYTYCSLDLFSIELLH